MKVKAEELYKALKEIEDFNYFETAYLNYENGVFNIELYIDEDTDEWYEGDNRYQVIETNFDKLWKPLVASDMIDYLIAFVKAGVKNNDTIKIIFTTEDYLIFQIAKSIELSFNYSR
jgi:hypothetical protein